MRGNEVEASKATGFVIDAAKAAGTTVAGIAGAALAGLVFGATAPVWLPGAIAIGVSAGAVWLANKLNDDFHITDNLKKGANSLIKGMRGWFK